MKEKIIGKSKILLIIILLTFIISIPYLNFESITTHDISYHVNRILSISDELKAGNFPVLIHSNLLEGFGYANSLFYPELFLYIPAVLILVGINFLTSYKVLIILSTFFTLIFTFYSANIIFKKKNIAWIVTLLYSGSFYRISDIYERGALGEILALVFLPLILAGLYEIILGDNKKWWLICFGIFGIVNSHVLSFAMTIILILVICLLNIVKIFKDKKRLINLIIAGIVSILLVFSFVIPYLEQSNNDKFNVDEKIYDGEFLKNYSVSLEELINNRFYTYDEFYKGMGTILLILPMFIFLSKNKDDENKFMKQLFGIGIVLLFMTTSLFPWEKVCSKFSFITIIQFPYRLNIITTLVFSFVGGYSLCNLFNNKKEFDYVIYIGIMLIILEMISSININSKNFTEKDILDYAPVGNGEYKPYGLSLEDKDVHNIANENKIDFTRKNSSIEFYYENQDDEMIIHIPLTYYKGYISYIEEDNGNIIELTVSEDENSKNVIVSSDKIINGKITVEYKMTKIQKISYITTILTFLGLILYIYISKYKVKLENKEN